MGNLSPLFKAVADSLDGSLAIEQVGREALMECSDNAACLFAPGQATDLPIEVMEILKAPDAHPACQHIIEIPLPWSPPSTSTDPTYIEHSKPKVHVELLGPNGLVTHDKVRLGIYGMLPHAEYGIRTHPAEEVFIMLAGNADWMSGDSGYQTLNVGDRCYHPSGMPHANRTTDSCFMSVYIWAGDVATDNYVYEGIPGKGH